MKRVMPLPFAVFATLFFFSSCSSCQDKEQTGERKVKETITSGVINISCDESFEPIMEQEIMVFEAAYPKASIIPYYVSETEALNMLLQDSVRLAVATRPLTAKEEASFKSRQLRVRTVQIALDAIAFIVNKNNKHDVISVDDLSKIMTGEVTRWNQIYSGSSLGEIKFVFDNQGSSSMRYAIDSLCQGKPLYKGLFARKSNQAVIDYVAQTPNAIGVIGASWIGNKADTTNTSFTDVVKVMAVRKAPGFDPYKPYQYYIATGDYPLTRPIYMITTDPRNGLPTGFIKFVSSQRGQLIIFKTGIVPSQTNIALKRDVSVTDVF